MPIHVRSGTHLDALAASHRLRPLRWLAPLLFALVHALGIPAPAAGQTPADSTVTLTWTASGDDGTTGTATSYGLRFRSVGITGTDTTGWWNAATVVAGMPAPRAPGSTDSVKVRGLTPLTTYYFVLRVADEVPNWSGYSNLAVKTTSGDVTAPAAVGDLAVTATTGTSVAVRWTAPGDDGATGTATTYDIRYSTSAITASNWGTATQATGEPAPVVAGTAQTFTVNGLTPSRTYYFAMKATDDAGNVSALSNVPSGTTADTIAPAPVRDLSLNPDSEPTDPAADQGPDTQLASNAR